MSKATRPGLQASFEAIMEPDIFPEESESLRKANTCTEQTIRTDAESDLLRSQARNIFYRRRLAYQEYHAKKDAEKNYPVFPEDGEPLEEPTNPSVFRR